MPLRLIALLLALCLSGPALALDPDRRLDQLHHTAWLARDGAPTDIAAISQSADGYLWLGTATGLYRFDGLSFERIELFPGAQGQRLVQNIASLRHGPDGTLWVGFRIGTVMRLSPQGELRWYGFDSGLPVGTVFSLATEADGRVWAGTSRGLFTLRGERWERVGPEAGLPESFIGYLMQDPDGTLWVSVPQRRWYARRPGQTNFERITALDGTRDLTRDGSGRHWIWNEQSQLVLRDQPGRPLQQWSLRYAITLMADRDGSIWVCGDGVQRIAAPLSDRPQQRQLEHFGVSQGLTSNRVLFAFEDRDGNLWFGTGNGLDRFRPATAVPAPFPGRLDIGSLAPVRGGGVIAGSMEQAPTWLQADQPARSVPGDYGPENRYFGVAHRAADGSIWMGGIRDLWRLENGRMRRMPVPDDIAPQRPVQAIGSDAQGRLLVAWVATGLYHWNGRNWEPPSGGAVREIVMFAQPDVQGASWRGLATGQLIRRDAQGRESVYGPEQGLKLGMLMSMYSRGERLWVGGESGAALRLGERFLPLRLDAGPALRSVSGLIETPEGELWLNDESGILRVRAATLQRWLAQAEQGALQVERLDWRDGVLGPAPQIRNMPSAVESEDGRLWFSRGGGIYWVDPQRRSTARQPPSVLLRQAWVDEQPLALQDGAALPVDMNTLRIGYTAPAPGGAEQLRFRYRLLGMSARWEDAGERREAVFTHLDPGDYRFELQAYQADGWQSTPVAWRFSVPPAFYQTAAFRALMLALAALLGWALYRWRLAAHCRRLQEQIEARLSERERIARELHDTLLQSTQALSLQVEAGVQALPTRDPVRARFERALAHADATLIEARERVLDLRRHQDSEQELSDALREAVLALRGAAGAPEVLAEVQGTERPLVPAIWHEALRLGLEAAQNALHHAQASRLRLCTHYGAEEFVLTVADDGIGIPAERLAQARSAGAASASTGADGRGHFGLIGLYERARQMGAQLDIGSTPGQGTRVQLRLRAQGAYARRTRQAGLLGWLSARTR